LNKKIERAKISGSSHFFSKKSKISKNHLSPNGSSLENLLPTNHGKYTLHRVVLDTMGTRIRRIRTVFFKIQGKSVKIRENSPNPRYPRSHCIAKPLSAKYRFPNDEGF
jgi:mRNA-degrading endonuclease HigB of HigAB toxin-antitoxin module